MKKLLLASVLSISLTGVNADQFSSVKGASVGFVSDNTTVALALNLERTEPVLYGPYSPRVKSFCGVSSASESRILSFGYSDTLFFPIKDDFYIIACVKAANSIFSGDVVVMVTEPNFQLRSNDKQIIIEEDLINLQNKFDNLLQ